MTHGFRRALIAEGRPMVYQTRQAGYAVFSLSLGIPSELLEL